MMKNEVSERAGHEANACPIENGTQEHKKVMAYNPEDDPCYGCYPGECIGYNPCYGCTEGRF